MLRRYHMMNVIILCVLAVVATVLDSIWFSFIPEKTASKILITAAVIGVAAGLVYAVLSNIDDEKKKAAGKYLD